MEAGAGCGLMWEPEAVDCEAQHLLVVGQLLPGLMVPLCVLANNLGNVSCLKGPLDPRWSCALWGLWALWAGTPGSMPQLSRVLSRTVA